MQFKPVCSRVKLYLQKFLTFTFFLVKFMIDVRLVSVSICESFTHTQALSSGGTLFSFAALTLTGAQQLKTRPVG